MSFHEFGKQNRAGGLFSNPNRMRSEAAPLVDHSVSLRTFGRALDNPGNSRDKALTIKNYPYKNEARIGDDENGSDYYKIKQDKDKQIKFTIEVENDEGVIGPSLTFALQNKNGKTLASDQVSGTDSDEIVKKLGKGTYYIKVSTGGESVPYDIEVRKN